MLGQERDRIPLSLGDIGKLIVGGVGVYAAWRAVNEIERLANFILGKKPDIPFEPNDVLYVRMQAKGRFPKDKKREYEFWREVVIRLTNNLFVPKIPYTRYFVAKQTGSVAYDWKCPVESDTHFCDQVLVRIPLEFPSGMGNTYRRKAALLKVTQKRAESAYGTQMKRIIVGLRSMGGVPDFEEGAEETLIAGFESRFKPVPMSKPW